MRLLLDTHALLWALSAPERLPASLRSRLEDPAVGVWCSAASAWEIAIKQSIGKLHLASAAEVWLPANVEAAGFDWLPISPEDALRVRALPFHHQDPFDRMLLAQAMAGFQLVTADARLQAYGVPILWA